MCVFSSMLLRAILSAHLRLCTRVWEQVASSSSSVLLSASSVPSAASSSTDLQHQMTARQQQQQQQRSQQQVTAASSSSSLSVKADQQICTTTENDAEQRSSPTALLTANNRFPTRVRYLFICRAPCGRRLLAMYDSASTMFFAVLNTGAIFLWGTYALKLSQLTSSLPRSNTMSTQQRCLLAVLRRDKVSLIGLTAVYTSSFTY